MKPLTISSDILSSEEDVRTKIIFPWLKEHGFLEDEILIERGVKVKLGKQYIPRVDILVKSSISGMNLIVIEVKKSSHTLTEEDKSQAISYASILEQIAPFTILTNGKDTHIYDTVSRIRCGLNESHKSIFSKIELKSPAELLRARVEALERIISLNSEDFLEFCKGQVSFRMRPLKGNDLDQDKKYIPQLYVERSKVRKDLEKKLFEKKENLALIVGQPLHGKTCFMCHTVERFLSEGKLCLFYPAIGLRGGLLNAIKEDFEWYTKSSLSEVEIINRLNTIVQNKGKELFLFIDGWNELDRNIALALNEAYERIDNHGSKIRIVLSTTSPSLQNLLFENGNPTFVADKIKLNERELVRKIASDKNDDYNQVICVGDFTSFEKAEAVYKYSRAFEIIEESLSLSNEKLLSNPFYLRLASKIYKGNSFPKNLTRTDLLRMSLIKKGERVGLSHPEIFQILDELGNWFYNNNKIKAKSLGKLPEVKKHLDKLCEASILATFYHQDIPEFYFYYTHDKNFSVAILAKDWIDLFKNGTDQEILLELTKIKKIEYLKEIADWFFSLPKAKDLFKRAFTLISFSTKDDIIEHDFLLMILFRHEFDNDWLESVMDETNIELVVIYINNNIDSFSDNEFKTWLKILLVIDTLILESVEDSYTIKLLEKRYGELYSSGNKLKWDEQFVALIEELIIDENDSIIKRAGILLSYHVDFEAFLIILFDVTKQFDTLYKRRIFNCCSDGISMTVSSLHTSYYGGMCKGLLDDSLRQKIPEVDDWILSEYLTMKDLIRKLSFHFSDNEILKDLYNILKDLRYCSGYFKDQENEEEYYYNPNQLKLPLYKWKNHR